MVSRTPTLKSKPNVEYYGARTYLIEDCDKDDTITFGEFSGDEDLLVYTLRKQSDGTAVTCTVSKNVITITGAGSSMDLVALVFGRLA
jgi:hypothetical protein